MITGRAYQLLELLLVVSIFSILLGIAVPMFLHYQNQQKTDKYAAQLANTIAAARLLAIEQADQFTLCPIGQDDQCYSDWNNQLKLRNSQREIVQTFAAIPKPINISWRSNFGHNHQLQFLATGFTNGQLGSFELCAPDGQGSKVVVQLSGRTRIESITCHI